MEGPRPARAQEFAELMEFIDRVFRPGQRGRRIYQRQYPHLYRPAPAYVARNLVMRDGDDIVGSLAVHPLRLRLEEVTLPAGGVGAVGTHPERRGEGIMTCLLQEAVRRMQGCGHVLAVLGGDRQRYGWFGWENGGVRNTFLLTSRQLGPPTPAERRLPIRRLAVTPAVARRLLAVDRQRPYGVERSRAQVRPLFERTSRDVWGCTAGGRFAYVVLAGPHHGARPYECVDEAGGDPEVAISILRVLMARHHRERLCAVAGPNPVDVALYRPHSASWERAADGMVKIVNLACLVELLEPLLRRRAAVRGVTGRFGLCMRDSRQNAELRIGEGPEYPVELGDRDMVTLVFGLLPVSEVFGAAPAFARLDGILPLPLHVPPLHHV
ncbi:MAG: GNAT family N-acetyltransferase [Candidatus Latescibacterota bacterium]